MYLYVKHFRSMLTGSLGTFTDLYPQNMFLECVVGKFAYMNRFCSRIGLPAYLMRLVREALKPEV